MSTTKEQVVRSYFDEVQIKMDASRLGEFFHDDVRIHSEMGTLRGLKQFEYLIRSLYWPVIQPGTVTVELSFLPLTAADKDNHPRDPSELIKFRAVLTANRKRVGPDGSSIFQHTVTNVWRIVDDKCMAAWPDIAEGGKDSDVLAEASVSIAG